MQVVFLLVAVFSLLNERCVARPLSVYKNAHNPAAGLLVVEEYQKGSGIYTDDDEDGLQDGERLTCILHDGSVVPVGYTVSLSHLVCTCKINGNINCKFRI